MEHVDVIVIGSGQGGVPAAVKLAWQGKQVVLFEKGALGGSCPNYGCYPSKAFLGAAFTIPRRDRAGLWGIDVTTRVDFTKLMERVRSKLGARHIKDSLDRAGVRTVMAAASFTAERTVSAGGDTYEAQTVIINTGNGPFVPPIPGLEGTPFMTYIDFWQLKQLPPRIIILGGGYIGVELGQGLARRRRDPYRRAAEPDRRLRGCGDKLCTERRARVRRRHLSSGQEGRAGRPRETTGPRASSRCRRRGSRSGRRVHSDARQRRETAG